MIKPLVFAWLSGSLGVLIAMYLLIYLIYQLNIVLFCTCIRNLGICLDYRNIY